MSVSPNHGDRRTHTEGVIIHSTRGGASTYAEEFESTVWWFENPASEVSAHAIVGYYGELDFPVPYEYTAWHAVAHNSEWLGIEVVQPGRDNEYSDAQYSLTAMVVLSMQKVFGFPLDRDHIKGHDEIDPKKSDPGSLWDWDKFMALLNPAPPAANIVPIPASLDKIWAVAQQLKSWGEAFVNQALIKKGVILEDAVRDIKEVTYRDPTQP